MDSYTEQILDDEYSAYLEKLRNHPEWISDEEYENARSTWIMKKIETGIITLL